MSVLTRRQVIQSAAGPLLAASAAPAERPNILWITCEDTSPDLGCYGDSEARTPNLDRLASEGARFQNAFSVAGVCAPSRSGIITGMYPSSIGTHHMRSQGVPPPYVKCFTEYLRAAGYFCTNNVKTDYNFAAPLTAWDQSSNRAHWRNRGKGQPFFSVFNIVTTHESRIRVSAEEFAELTRRLRPEDRHDPARAKLPPYYPDTPVVRRDWANYYDLVTAMDLQAADLLKQLDDDGLASNTVVFFYGDHGRGLPRAKRWIYDSGVRVPLIVRWPGKIKPGTVRADLVSLIDLAPALLSIAGLPIPRHLQGQPFLGDAPSKPREHVFFIRDRMDETYDMMRGVRTARFKYIRNYQPGKPYAQYIHYMDQMPTLREWRRLNAEGKLEGPQKLFFAPEKPEEELYDVVNDPHEISNLAGSAEHRNTLAQLRAVQERWMEQIKDLGKMKEADLQERMRPGGKWATTAEVKIDPPGGSFTGPVKITMRCPTEGASIAWTTDTGPGAHWKLYAGEFSLPASAVLRAKACRLGYLDSKESLASFRLT